ncbi:sigma-70 family RNA polymerase sigma factor [Neolewinella sp.]|uniref:sigma-70 family RNA polymerase sigma factor n=1 Tax=Neolewinella sp. TaxID=2993543 RepID=UPI003B528AA1
MKIARYQQASELWLDYRQALQSYLRGKVQDAALAEELTQRVLLKVVDACCSDIEVRNVRAWLYQISRNVLADYYRGEGAGPQVQAEWQSHRTPTEGDSTPDVWQDMEPYLRPLLSLLPEHYATPLRLADLEGMKQQEIAEQLELGLSAVKSRIQRARVMLREKIVECSHLELDKDGRPVDFAIRACCSDGFSRHAAC